MALLIDMVRVLIHVFSDAASFVGFNTGYRVPLVLRICVVLLSVSGSGNSLTSLLVSWSMFPVSYLGHSSRKTHSFYRTGMSPYLYNHNKPSKRDVVDNFLGDELPLTLFQTQIGHLRYPLSDIPPPPRAKKKNICTCFWLLLSLTWNTCVSNNSFSKGGFLKRHSDQLLTK